LLFAFVPHNRQIACRLIAKDEELLRPSLSGSRTCLERSLCDETFSDV
jgi:hypothetical protein